LESVVRTQVIGLEMPDDFPTVLYDRINDQMPQKLKDRYPVERSEAAGGWGALGYRFRSAAEDSDAFVESLNVVGDTPEHEFRYLQEKYLYGFFVGGQSAIESFGYSVYAVCAMVKPTRFSVSSDQDRRDYSLETLRDKLFSALPNEPLAQKLGGLLSDPAWNDWKLVRNTLAHRSAPPRQVQVHIQDWALGQPPDPPPASTKEVYWLGRLLEPDTTIQRREQLARWVDELLTAYERFLQRHT
jgi:hypothetical protein